MEEGEYSVRKVRPSDTDSDKEMVFLEGGMRGFKADKGKYSEGDTVEVEEYEDYKGNTSYRVAEKK